MEAELAEVRDFLARHAPFEDLPADVLATLPRRLTVRYVRRGTRILSVGQDNDVMFVLRSGAVDITGVEGALVERSDPGTSFGMSTLVKGGTSRYDFTAIEDSLLLVMPGAVFHQLSAAHPRFQAFYTTAHTARLRRAVSTLQASNRGGAVLKTAVQDLVRRPPVSTTGQATIRSAAQVMSDEGVSSLLVMDGARLTGILTDRDLRNRVLAAGRSPSDPVESVMTPAPVTVPAYELAFEVLLDMVDRGIHHLPVVDRTGTVVGMVTSSDLVRLEHDNPVYLVADVAAQGDVPGLSRVAARIPAVLEQLVAEDATADDMGRVVTALGDAVERRLLALVEDELGPPPVPYCWAVLGSQARSEQGLASDQDNALVLSDEARPEHDAYFRALAERVSTGLQACGYPPCPGDIMATNARWRASQRRWRRQFAAWLDQPEPQAVLHAAVFYDMRPLHGDAALVEDLRGEVLARTAQAQLFLSYLALHAVHQRPPLGFFRGFVLEKEGERRDTVDLKRGAVGSVVELARVHALVNGHRGLNTRVRLEDAARAGTLSEPLAAELRDALEFMAYLRLRHQGTRVRSGLPPDNYLRPEELSGFERRHLRDAFQVVRAAQQALAQRMNVATLA